MPLYIGTEKRRININNARYLVQLTSVYTLMFDANGGIGSMSSISGAPESRAVISANIFSRLGHDFTGWNTESDGSGTMYRQGDEIILDSNITLYAQWAIRTYKVDFYKSLTDYAKWYYETFGAAGGWQGNTGNQDIYGVYISTDNGATYSTLDTSYYRGNFSESGFIKSMTNVNYGTKLKVWVTYNRAYSAANANIIVDGVTYTGTYIEKEITITSNTTIDFRCVLEGVAYAGGKAFWDCYVTT